MQQWLDITNEVNLSVELAPELCWWPKCNVGLKNKHEKDWVDLKKKLSSPFQTNKPTKVFYLDIEVDANC